MASAILTLFFVGLANVVLSQDATPSSALVAPSIVNASGSFHAVYNMTVGGKKYFGSANMRLGKADSAVDCRF